jgi:hypothetical protein
MTYTDRIASKKSHNAPVSSKSGSNTFRDGTGQSFNFENVSETEGSLSSNAKRTFINHKVNFKFKLCSRKIANLKLTD